MQEPMNRFPSLASLLIAAFAWTAASPSIADDAEQATPSRKAYTLWQQGYLLHIQGRYAEATETFQDSIDILPTAEAHTYLGWSLSKLGFLQEAIAECKKAIPIDPDYGNPYNDIGVYLIDLGREDNAIPWLKKAMRAKRYCCYQFPHFNLGRILMNKEETAAAELHFRRALEYDPEYVPALLALDYLKRQGLKAL